MIEIKVEKLLKSATGNFMLQLEGSISPGTFLTLYGPSGAGKTSSLKLLSGLLTPDTGIIQVDNQMWFNSSKAINKGPQYRDVGHVFQDYALFPNMTVGGNLRYALGKHHESTIVDELIDIMELNAFVDRYPSSLSGGQQQRVALARSLVQKPKLLLLDEPLSALDHVMRTKLQSYIQRVHDQYNLTTILVSHNLSEVLRLSDEVWIIESGKISKKGAPAILFESSSVEGKFQFTGTLVGIEKVDVVYILSVLINNEIIKVACSQAAIVGLSPGDEVMVASKAFNPIVRKIG